MRAGRSGPRWTIASTRTSAATTTSTAAPASRARSLPSPTSSTDFTRDHAKHERALRRLTRHRPNQIRTRTAAFTYAALAEVARRIRADARAGSGFLDGYGRAGFLLHDVDIEAQTVTVRLASTRPDHAAWFSARYGPAVRTEVMGERFECAAPFE